MTVWYDDIAADVEADVEHYLDAESFDEHYADEINNNASPVREAVAYFLITWLAYLLIGGSALGAFVLFCHFQSPFGVAV